MSQLGIARLSGIDAKLARADEHLNALKSDIRIWDEPNTQRTSLYIRQDAGWYIVESLPVPKPPIRWALIIGDLLHNLRSALDHLIWQLVLRDGHQPSRRNQFPIFDTEKGFFEEIKFRKIQPERSALYGITADGDAWTIIEEAQPYKRPVGDANWFLLIGRFSNIDKHNTLHTQMTFPGNDTIGDLIGWSDDAILLEERVNTEPLSFERQTEIVRYQFTDDPDPEVYMKGALAVDPTFGDESAKGALQVTLRGYGLMIDEVRNLINLIRILPRVTD